MEAALALGNDGLGMALFMTIVPGYILAGLYTLERVGSRFVWSFTLDNGSVHLIRTVSYPMGLYVITLDGKELLRGRSWRLVKAVDFQLGDQPSHRAEVKFRNYRWPPRLSLDVDGRRLAYV
jgi:hypothetical protein